MLLRLAVTDDLPALLDVQQAGSVLALGHICHRARRFYEKMGWRQTDRFSRTTFPPHPVLVEYVLTRA